MTRRPHCNTLQKGVHRRVVPRAKERRFIIPRGFLNEEHRRSDVLTKPHAREGKHLPASNRVMTLRSHRRQAHQESGRTVVQSPFRHVTINRFGPIGHADLPISPQLNVILGDNGTGKSQLLKLMYSVSHTFEANRLETIGSHKSALEQELARKLVTVFRPETLGRLVTRAPGRSRSEVEIHFSQVQSPVSFNFATNSQTKVNLSGNQEGRLKESALRDTSVFLPPQELLTLAPWLPALYEGRELGIEETWRDTSLLLMRPPFWRTREMTKLLEDIEQEVLHGRLDSNDQGFYLKRPGTGNFEAHLMADGERKLAMLTHLVTNGVLLDGGYLFWDEPEANLNPRSQRYLARFIVKLASAGTQIFISTHSLFLLRELQISITEQRLESNFIAFSRDADGDGMVTATAHPDLGSLNVITALDEESAQSGRYLSFMWDN